MATIVDPDLLRLSSQASSGIPDGEVFINATATPPTIELISTTEWAGSNFTAADGVSLQALYSFLKDQWKNNDTDDFFRYKFPMEAITAEQFEFINNWEPSSDTVRTYIRTGGWAEKDDSSPAQEKQAWMGVITLGSIGASQTAYYAWYDPTVPGFITTPEPFTFSGAVNEPVKVYGDGTHGGFEYRNKQLFVYIRPAPIDLGGGTVEGYTFDQSSTAAIGSGSGVTYQVYRFPLSTGVDLNINLLDAAVSTLITNAGLEIRFDQASLTSAQLPIELQGGPYNFTHVIQSTNGDVEALTPAEVYNFVQYQLRQTGDIDADTGTRTGKLTEELVTFVGSTLETFAINGGTEGVLIDNFATSQTANFKFRDNSNVLQSFPTVASGTITFSPTLQDDPSTRYWMFYTTANGGANVWPGTNALLVPDFGGTPITGYYHIPPGATAVASGTTDGAITGGGAVLTSTAGGLTVDALIGKVLRITAGNNVGFYFIADNDTTTITIDGLFENTDASNTVSWEVYDKNTSSISWDFNYDSAVVRGDGNQGNPAEITIVALGLDNAQYVTTSGTISSASGQNFPVTAPLERNYSDPV